MEEPDTSNLQTKRINAEKLLNSILQPNSSSGIYYQLKINLYNLCLTYWPLQLPLPTKHITLVPTFSSAIGSSTVAFA